MTFTLPALKIGNPIKYEALTVFPLFSENCGGGVPYALSDEVIGKTVTVSEVGKDGSVPDLLVENRGDSRVLFLEGQELIGAKQNRILNVSLLVAAHSKTPVPVSCVEQGRWGYRSPTFGSSGTHSPSKIRRILKRSVYASTKAKRGHRSDQGGVWLEVSRQQAALDTRSATSALSDTFNAYREKLQHYLDALRPIEGACGLAVAVGGEMLGFDLFDKPETCQKVWNGLLSGFVLDAIEAHELLTYYRRSLFGAPPLRRVDMASGNEEGELTIL